LGVALSALCVVHCAALPFLLAALPALDGIAGEWVHVALLFAVVPVAGWALISGARKHGQWMWAAVGSVGIAALLLAHPLEHVAANELVGTAGTVLGALIVAVAHIGNHRRCADH
jgi:hypothetical protein